MLKMTFTLAVALYAGFVVWGVPVDKISNDRPARTVAVASLATEYDKPVIVSQGGTGVVVTRAAVSATIVPDAATIAASAPLPTALEAPRQIGEPVVVSLIRPDAPEAVVGAGIEAEVTGLYKVSGTRVNMRSGPSTANTVVESLTGGSLTELIGEEQNGWVQIRDIASGQTGYMAARFLEPA